ncbi:MAG TPA: CzcE family metal-binding protein [Burkholderiaceae bacterium]|nr:CzcE family metal-binding protein [Burkholderiaceae bacterium]
MNKALLHTSIIIGLLFGATAPILAQARAGLQGTPAQNAMAERVVDLDSTRTVNVVCGDIVTFRSGGQSFTWRFDVLDHSVVNLADIAPAGFPTRTVRVFVAGSEDERTSGA